MYDAILRAGAKPAGAFAQTAMRIEKRYLSFGHDLDTDINPLQSGLEFAVAWDTDFVGRQALLKLREQPPAAQMTTIILDDTEAVPLGNEPVYRDGEIVGKTTSAAFGYRIGKPLALAYLDAAKKANDVEVDIAGLRYKGSTSLGPAFDPSGKRMRNPT